MPELPEVETVVRGLRPVLTGKTITAVRVGPKALRFPWPESFADRLTGRRVQALSRRAKSVVIALDDDQVWLAHLGMTGRFVAEAAGGVHQPGAFYDASPRQPGHDHLSLDLSGGGRLIYNDVRRFGYMKLMAAADLEAAFATLGAEPLDPALTPEALYDLCHRKTMAIKPVIMDQRLLVGVGNIYASEALFLARIDPSRSAQSMSLADWRVLLAAIQQVLSQAIAAGGSTLRDYAQIDGQRGGYQAHFQVYDRAGEPCPHCQTPIQKRTQTGRSTFYCATCQT